jgi:putative addiction module component (TIGR02574 family)
MSTDQLLAEILRLPREKQFELRDKLNQSLDDAEPDPDMTPELRAELDRRHQNMVDHPEDEVSWEEACAELDKRRAARNQK